MTTALACAFAAAVLTVVMVVYEVGSSPVVLQLERALPRLNHTLDVAALLAHDLQRSSRLQQSPVPGGVVDFPLHGSIEIGNYYTKVKLGTPPTEFKLLVDTGSTISWVRCSGIGSQGSVLRSSASRALPCSDWRCKSKDKSVGCSGQSDQCGFSIIYGDLSSISGYLVADQIYFDMYTSQTWLPDRTVPIIFGCGTRLSKLFEMDGILAFGPGLWSIITQLSEEGVTPSAFSHCLDGGLEGGGTLVLGEALEPGMVYTPLVPSKPHYNVQLQSIAVNGQMLPIDSKVFDLSQREIIIDSGTTYALLAADALYPLMDAITGTITSTPVTVSGLSCYDQRSYSVSSPLPTVSFNFIGGGSMLLKPEDYLVQLGSLGPASLHCIGFQKAPDGLIVLGELVLKNKIIVYDLGQQRIGWTPYDCSQPMNVSIAPSPPLHHKGEASSSRRLGVCSLVLVYILLYLFDI
ncbi:aspartic proteinase-like protein 2 [Punica granatum]|uniref:Aspartic proteinase-like protein 2 n=1 Tax=Punica granatum TaxID=22663 RepID=A0A6P8DHP5_PUNGR|nr:aspartic proteinase-like protein 2 [Punica granatum]